MAGFRKLSLAIADESARMEPLQNSQISLCEPILVKSEREVRYLSLPDQL